jgi:hypothetical protein
MGNKTSDLSDEKIETLAREASVATKSIMRRLVGLPVRGMAGDRADRVLREHGLAPRTKSNPPAAHGDR